MAASIFVGTPSPTLSLPRGQIAFPATQVPSPNANTLDDYNEFDWTPTIGGSGGQSGQVYSIQEGHGIKIGQLVFVYGRVQLSTLGTITTAVQIQSLPYVANNFGGNDFTSCYIGSWANLTASFDFIAGIITPGSSAITLEALSTAASGVSTLIQANLAATSLFDFAAYYRTTN